MLYCISVAAWVSYVLVGQDGEAQYQERLQKYKNDDIDESGRGTIKNVNNT